ncbi:MAG: hypothetical protein QF645_07845 [Planctomycetota bacterium]|nr:hypothetical protein [Planctomycetota bacterium]
MRKRTGFRIGAFVFTFLGLFLLGQLLSGSFRRDTSVLTGHVVHVEAEGCHYQFLYQTRVYEGVMEGSSKEGAEVQVFFNPADPSRNHARTDGEKPPLYQDSGFPLPVVGGIFALVIGIGFGIALRRV